MTEPKTSKFIPTAAAARRAGIALPSVTPTQRYPVAALIVRARILRREVWSEKKSITQELADKLPHHPPKKGKPGGLYHVIGKQFRSAARWQGFRPELRVRLDHYHDKLVRFSEAYVPSGLLKVPGFGGVETAFEALVMARLPPECLRCLDLTPRSVGGAYRVSARGRQPKFHGHDFGDTIKRGSRTVHRILAPGQVMRSDIRAYAWPLLWLHYDTIPAQDFVLVVDHEGNIHGLTGFAPEA